MERSQVPEFHFIAPIANVASILDHGILSHNRAALLQHFDISMQKIQELRGKKRVPGGLPLHDYGNLYFNGRNKMMAKKRPQHAEICVLRVAPNVLDLPGAIIADQNASSQYVLFLPSPAGLRSYFTVRFLRGPGDVPTTKLVNGVWALRSARNS